jgi:hypothetical protein
MGLTVQVAIATEVVKPKSVKKVIADTTVIGKGLASLRIWGKNCVGGDVQRRV